MTKPTTPPPPPQATRTMEEIRAEMARLQAERDAMTPSTQCSAPSPYRSPTQQLAPPASVPSPLQSALVTVVDVDSVSDVNPVERARSFTALQRCKVVDLKRFVVDKGWQISEKAKKGEMVELIAQRKGFKALKSVRTVSQ
jgi:hypothetical protein